jgi:hypothetical protein
MATVLLGSTSPRQAPVGTSVAVNGEASEPVEDAPVAGKSVVLIETPDDEGLDKQLAEVRNAFRLHSHEDAAWVEGGDDFFAKAVSQVFNCPVGRPDDWDAEDAQEPVSDHVDTQGGEAPLNESLGA